MLIGVLLATVTAVTWGSISVLEARVSRALGGQSALAWVFAVGLVVDPADRADPRLPGRERGRLGLGDGLRGLLAGGPGPDVHRRCSTAASASSPPRSPSQGAFASIYAAIGGESLHPLSVVAIAVSAVGTFVLMSGDGGLQAPPRERRGILLALGAACFTGLSLFAASRGGSGIGADWVLVCIRLSSVALVLRAARRDAPAQEPARRHPAGSSRASARSWPSPPTSTHRIASASPSPP